MNKTQKLEIWAEKELKRNLNSLILPDDGNGFVAFGKYHLQPTDQGVTVTMWDREIHCFANKRHAISWCIADHNQNYSLANRLVVLDRKKQTLGSDIQIRRNIGERSRNESFHETVTLKLQPKLDALIKLDDELEKCINSAKYLQIKGFANETARTRCT